MSYTGTIGFRVAYDKKWSLSVSMVFAISINQTRHSLTACVHALTRLLSLVKVVQLVASTGSLPMFPPFVVER